MGRQGRQETVLCRAWSGSCCTLWQQLPDRVVRAALLRATGAAAQVVGAAAPGEPLLFTTGAVAPNGRSYCTGWQEPLHWVAGGTTEDGRSRCFWQEDPLHWVASAIALGGRNRCFGWQVLLCLVAGAVALGGWSHCHTKGAGRQETLIRATEAVALSGRSSQVAGVAAAGGRTR